MLVSFLYFFKDNDSDEPPKVAVIAGELCDKKEDSVDRNGDLVYAINDRPPWYLCILLGFQVKHTSACMFILLRTKGFCCSTT